jgi:hypothetical protein
MSVDVVRNEPHHTGTNQRCGSLSLTAPYGAFTVTAVADRLSHPQQYEKTEKPGIAWPFWVCLAGAIQVICSWSYLDPDWAGAAGAA